MPTMYFHRSVVFALLAGAGVATPAEPHWFEQRVDHFSTSTATYKQRYYENVTHFGGPGSPIFCIIGGEGGVPPETGIFYPWITDVLAREYGALVVQPEHRFYGESLPFGPEESFTADGLAVMNSQQALADTAHFIRDQQRLRNCTAPGTPGYCPVLTIGGSYPGFLSAMMRVRYPGVVDMAYAASAPTRFYSQNVTSQYDYYTRVTESAEKALPGCASAVRAAFESMLSFFDGASQEEVFDRFAVCPGAVCGGAGVAELGDDLLFLAEQTFAGLNMGNYPPGPSTGLSQACARFVAAKAQGGTEPLLDAIRDLLLQDTQALSSSRTRRPEPGAVHAGMPASCFNVSAQCPAGQFATARCGDWSGCGVARDGEMWDYQTCTFEVERIGFGSATQMFPERSWTMQWLKDHCARRFGVEPQPKDLDELWGFSEDVLKKQSSRIIFTNGLMDGWSVGGTTEDVLTEKGIIAINLPNGAHHSDLTHSYPVPGETPDISAAHARITDLIGNWLRDVRSAADERVV